MSVNRKRIITNLWNDCLVRKELEEIVSEMIKPAQYVLDNSMDMNDVIRARGEKSSLMKLLMNLGKIAEAEENENG